MATATASASWADLLSGRNGVRSVALAGGTALHAVNIYVVTTIMPSIVRDIGGLAYYAWNTTLFVVASIIGATLAAALAGRLGGKGAYLLGLAVFSVGALVCAAAPSMPWLLAGRSLQGLGGGVLVSLAYVLIRQVFEPALWSRAMGLVSAMWGIATLSGPAIGGVFAQLGEWRWAFWSLLPAVAVLGAIVLAWLPSAQADGERAAVPGGRLALLALSVLAVSMASLAASRALQCLGIGISLALAALIVRADRNAQARLLPTGSYAPSRLRSLYLVMALLVIGSTVEIFVPYFLQTILGHEPLEAGYLTAVMAAGWSFGSMLSAGRDHAFGARCIRFGPLLMAVALALLAWQLQRPAEATQGIGFAALCLFLACVGLGIGMAWPHLLTRLLEAAPAEEGALASSSISTVQLYAMSLGAAVAGWVANAAGLSEPGGVPGARAAALWLLGGFALLVALGLPVARRAAPARA
ncbi:MFS transporter [Dyella sp. LX-66]|uniref:MFS transporter n=1 Tax=unclassified Dyella TaxID=2634549 RepID=UPI001BDFC0BD|nr:MULTISPECIES: MFS transporter [unclassified Dyella]MBT2118721.1 MFS transporter [Dyella sp. LX-1]MBT2141070.1 MFS transporter [Dyella sp. LX-66]